LGGYTIGTSRGAGGSVAISNADTVYDLAGPFANTSLSAGNGLGGSLDIFSGHDRNGQVVDGAGITFGAQSGLGLTTGFTGTTITPLHQVTPASSGLGGTSCP
jgi:hypothetical protein